MQQNTRSRNNLSTELLAIICLVLLASCKKDNPGTTPPTPPAQIADTRQTKSNGNNANLTKSYVYDADNRLKEIKLIVSGAVHAIEKYTYVGSLVQYRYTTGATEIASQSVDYSINSGGIAESSIQPYFNRTDIYEYNNAGFVTKINHTLNGSGIGYEIYHYRNNNVLDSISGYSLSGAKKDVQVFTYDAGKSNTVGNWNRGLKILGKDQAVPVKTKMTYVYSGSGLRTDLKNDFTYTFTSEGRIAKVTNTQTTYLNGIPSQTYIVEEHEYTYNQ